MSWHFRGRPLNSGLFPPRVEVQTKVGERKKIRVTELFLQLEKVGRSQSQLFLTNVSILHNGTYTCIAR